MKIRSPLRQTHEALSSAVYVPLKDRIDKIFSAIREPSWHYFSRIKGVESFVQKLETGRYRNAFLEDFFACTLVVENPTRVEAAKLKIGEHFEIKYSRPREPGVTHKRPDAFPFDDLRLYAVIKDDLHMRGSLCRNIFEIQIKTFLQHAWSIATHDLVYKTNKIEWAEERIAYQIKATLEHIDMSLSQGSITSQCAFLQLTDDRSKQVQSVIDFLTATWPVEALPLDLRRLAETIHIILKKAGIELSELSRLLSEEAVEGRGPKLIDLSPYSCIVSALFRHKRDQIVHAIAEKELSIFVPDEIDLPADICAEVKSKIVRECDIVYKE